MHLSKGIAHNPVCLMNSFIEDYKTGIEYSIFKDAAKDSLEMIALCNEDVQLLVYSLLRTRERAHADIEEYENANVLKKAISFYEKEILFKS